jgi:Protein of unknown function (DUF2934)
MSHNGSKPDYTEIERIAYRLWEERGRPIGSAEEDWFRAERQLRENGAAAADLENLSSRAVASAPGRRRRSPHAPPTSSR